MSFDNLPTALPYIRTGRLHALAVTGLKRSATAGALKRKAPSAAALPDCQPPNWMV